MPLTEGPTSRALATRLRNLSIEEKGDIFHTARALREHFVDPDQTGQTAGLLFGQIQSGKTNRMLASIAFAADNGYRCFIVLTSDNLWLYEQTVSRIRQSISSMRTVSLRDIPVVDDVPSIDANLRSNGVILVATKNVSVLGRLLTLCVHRVSSTTPTVIYDDEADQASLNNFINTDSEDPSAINGLIADIRSHFAINTYVQITATPQSLYLQRVDGEFRPSFTVVFEPGARYVGSDAYFGASHSPNVLRQIPPNEITELIERGAPGGFAVPGGLRDAICTYLLGAAAKIVRPEGAEPTSFSMLVHVSQRQAAHENVRTYVEGYIAKATEVLFDESRDGLAYQELLASLRAAYDDLQLTSEALPAFSELLEEVRTAIGSTDIQVLNASPNSGMPRFDSTYNILIGGNRLGRGVTIPRLLVTYYGRQVRTAQVDTVLQHARMYGYRRADLDVTRCFLTEELREVFTVIHDSNDQLLRSVREDGLSEVQPILLNRSGSTPLRPSRLSALPVSHLQVYLGGEAYFPRAPLAVAVDVLDERLLVYSNTSSVVPVTIDFILSILSLTESDAEDLNGTWDDVAIRACVRPLINICANQGTLLVRTNRNITKGKRAMMTAEDARLFGGEGPHLTMYRYNGSAEDGWSPAGPRWVPNLRFPIVGGTRRNFIFTPD